MDIFALKDVIPYNSLHISKYRLYKGYEKLVYNMKGNCDIFCLGGCDLETTQPIGNNNFTWFDKLSKFYECDRIGKWISNELQVDFLNYYFNNFCTPKVVCFTMMVMTRTFLNNTLYTYGENSARVIHYLYLKKYYNQMQAEYLQNKIKYLQQKTNTEKIEYAVNIIEKLQTICDAKKIKFLWTFNGTQSANKYYDPLSFEILNRVKYDSYVGWVKNIDFLPDSSIGEQTQQLMYQRFIEKI